MASEMRRLRNELENTLEMLRHLDDFSGGAVNFAALSVLFNSKPENTVLKVAVRDLTEHFFRGEIVAVNPNGGTADVLAEDGELVSGMPAERIIAVRIQDKM